MRQLVLRAEPYLTPLLAFSGLFFVSIIVITFSLDLVFPGERGVIANHLTLLAASVAASAICVYGVEGGRWELGVMVAPRKALRGLLRGCAAGVMVVGLADLIIVFVSGFRHAPGSGIDWRIVFSLLLPAAISEELVFRGYVLQRLDRLNRALAIGVTSVLFAIAHGGNPAVSPLAFSNILLAGILLALMWVYDQSLWMPTAAHFFWNAFSGPVLGHELSGLDLGSTLLEEIDPGPAWLTGGEFGIEASVVLTIVEVGAIAGIWWRIRMRDGAFAHVVSEPDRGAIELPDNAGDRHVNNQQNEVSSE